jgi:hypothetical protein
VDDVIGPDNSLVAGGEDDAACDEVNQIDVDEALRGSVLALGEDETQVGVDVLEQNGPEKKWLEL